MGVGLQVEGKKKRGGGGEEEGKKHHSAKKHMYMYICIYKYKINS